jgi:SNF2 family DNA or RNA helicase
MPDVTCYSTLPVKNRLPDIFWLAWWAAGGNEDATARWPYAGGSEEVEKFASTFMLSEFNHTRAENSETGGKFRFTKLRPEICNLHLLWKALAPICLRRRKQDIGPSDFRSEYWLTPKVACALTLIRDILRRNEQVAVFSAFNDSSDILSRCLSEAGISHAVLDGRTIQRKRGLAGAAFDNGEFPVALAGMIRIQSESN